MGDYDSIFKSLAEADPRGLLHLVGALPLSAPAEVTVEPRDLSLPAMAVDNVYRIRTPDREWLAHFEAQAAWKADIPERLAWYAAWLAFKYRMDVEVVLLLMARKYAPKQVPDRCRLRFGSVEIRVRYQVVRLWELDAELALSAGRPSLLPWVSLMDSSEEQIAREFELLMRLEDRNLVNQGTILGSLRYPKGRLDELIARSARMITHEDWMEVSWLYREIHDKGLAKGLGTGRIEEARRLVRRAIASRFPSLAVSPGLLGEGLDGVADVERLEVLLEQVWSASDEAAAREAIERAIGQG